MGSQIVRPNLACPPKYFRICDIDHRDHQRSMEMEGSKNNHFHCKHVMFHMKIPICFIVFEPSL